MWSTMSVDLKNMLAWISLLGIPSIFAMTAWCIKSCYKFAMQLKILMQAQQAQMRKDLLADYNCYIVVGWISDEHMKDWENRYQAYHSLGANGIMDSKRTQLLALPNMPPTTSNGGAN